MGNKFCFLTRMQCSNAVSCENKQREMEAHKEKNKLSERNYLRKV